MSSDISRSEWVDKYTEGYKLGARERKKHTNDRRPDVEDAVDQDLSDAEIEAMQAGFEHGKRNALPGADVEIEQEANKKYDKSEYSAGLGDFA